MTSTTQFSEATTAEDFIRIADLADTIWREHYPPIIGKAQVDYMLSRFQTPKAIADQVAENMNYFLIQQGETPVGYLAIQKKGRELFLSKIYLLKSHRGLGIGKKAMKFIEERALESGCDRIALRVNKDNQKSIRAYLKMGFENKGGRIIDIGDGFVMDDFHMVLQL